MMIPNIAFAGLLGMIAASALAQAPAIQDPAGVRAGLTNGDRDSLPRSDKSSNIVPADTSSNVAPTLPSPGLDLDAPARDFLRAARAALADGQTGKAQQALEMAETRSLGGSDTPALAQQPSSNPRVVVIRDALHALGNGDSARAMRIIDIALGS